MASSLHSQQCPGTSNSLLPVLANFAVIEPLLNYGNDCRDLAADLAQITFDFPFKIPPYFALIIRAISVLEGIALLGNPGRHPRLFTTMCLQSLPTYVWPVSHLAVDTQCHVLRRLDFTMSVC